MAIKLFHQCGHNTNWNIDSLVDDKCGDGLIFSPVHRKHDDVEGMKKQDKANSIFDPQFYLPNSQKTKLQTYPFFPESISPNSFATGDFTLVALEAARKCIDFQLSNHFSRVVIPARFYDQMYPDYIERQNGYTVTPFLKALSSKNLRKPVYLTLPLTSHMVISKIFRTQLLNWVTSFPEISGVYVLATPYDEGSKQIQSEEFLFQYMDFLQQLRNASLEVLVGYCNVESILFLMVEGCDITFGSFENTRMFSIDKFITTEEERRGPKARIFSRGLLNWVQIAHAKEIRDRDKQLWSKIYDHTDYGDRALKAAVEPTFNQPQLYKHHFILFSQFVSELRDLPIGDRYKRIRELLKEAEELYEEINDLPMDLERHSRGSHIQPWLTVLNRFYRAHVKKD